MIEINGVWIAIHWIKTCRIVLVNSDRGTTFQLKIDIGNISEMSFDYRTREEADRQVLEIVASSEEGIWE